MYEDLYALFSERVGELSDSLSVMSSTLPKVSGGIRSADLVEQIDKRIDSVEQDKTDLREMCESFREPKGAFHNPVMRVLAAEAKRISSSEGNPAVRDAAFLGVVQRMELSIGAVCEQSLRYASKLGYNDCKKRLQSIARDADRSHKTLGRVADGFVFTAGVEDRAMKKEEK